MIDRHIKETLYLVGMKVHRHDPVNPCRRKQVGDELCTD